MAERTPTPEDLKDRGAWQWLRRMLAIWGLAAMAAYSAVRIVLIGHGGGDGEWMWRYMAVSSMTVMALGGAAWSLTRQTVGYQLLGRSLVCGILLRLSLGRQQWNIEEASLAIALLATMGLLGVSRLAPDEGPFMPARFRGLLILAIVINGALAFPRLAGVISIVAFSEKGASQLWLRHIEQAAIGSVFLATAIGLYRLRVVALLGPLAIGLWLAYRGLFGIPYYRSTEEGMVRAIDHGLHWGWVQWGGVITLTVLPIIVGIVALRLKARPSGIDHRADHLR